MSKKSLRKDFLEKRKSFLLEEVITGSNLITHKLLETFDFKDKNISVFQSIPKFKEFNTVPFIELCKGNCFAPVMEANHQLKHVALSPETTFILNQWGINEPENGKELSPHLFDFVLVPLLVCDQKGNRLGYGGGYYDRFLAKCSKNCIFLGVGFFDPIVQIPEINEFDIPLHHYFTPNRHYNF